MTVEDATRVIVSYPEDLSDWGRFQVEKPSFRAFLTKTLGTVAVGHEWEEFVGVGCCGNTLDVPLRIERLETSSGDETEASVTRETAVEYTVREACGVRGGWLVQSRAGPTR